MTAATRDRETDMLIESPFNLDSELEVTKAALRAATERAERAEAEVAELRAQLATHKVRGQEAELESILDRLHKIYW